MTPVEHVVVAVAARAVVSSANGSNSGARLEHRERGGRHVVAGERGQVRRLLVGVAPQRRARWRRRAGRERGDREAHVAVGERLGGEHGRDRRALADRAAELLGDAEHREPELARLAEQLVGARARGVGVGAAGPQPLGGELAERLARASAARRSG